MNEPPKRRLRLRELLQSLAAAALGVQSQRNRARDFEHGKPAHFILLGLIGTTLFVLLLLGVVQLVLHLSRT